MNTPQVIIEGDRLTIHFDRFNLETYRLFLKAKSLPEYQVTFQETTESYVITAPARFAAMLGIESVVIPPAPLPMPAAMKSDQVAIVRLALSCKRFAAWEQCGLGKTFNGLEFGRQVAHLTGQRVLIVSFNEVVPQWLEEAAKFYGDSLSIRRITSRQEMKDWCAGRIEGPERLAITNYEKFNPDKGRVENQVVSELRHLGGIVLDEASRLKTGGGRQKWALVKSAKGIQYKLNLTATPAPNDYMEFASQGAFLEKMRDQGEIIWTFFTRDPKSHRWTIKKHARKAFFDWMSGWSIYVRDPRRYGWRMDMPDVPSPQIFRHELELTEDQREFLFTTNVDDVQSRMFADKELNAIQRAKQSQAAKGFIYVKGEEGPRKVRRIESRKPAFVADLIAKEVNAGHQVLVWTTFDAETRILVDELKKRHPKVAAFASVMVGSTTDEERPKILEQFRQGKSAVLISRARMLGYGMNFQCCTSMIFSGFTDSFEDFYQAVRRAYRFGQTKSLRVHLPVVPELEGASLDNVLRKQDRFEAAIDQMEENYIAAFGRVGFMPEMRKAV